MSEAAAHLCTLRLPINAQIKSATGNRLCLCAVSAAQTGVAAAVIEAAGLAAAAGIDAAGNSGRHWEVFFSRPTVSMPALCSAVADAATHVM